MPRGVQPTTKNHDSLHSRFKIHALGLVILLTAMLGIFIWRNGNNNLLPNGYFYNSKSIDSNNNKKNDLLIKFEETNLEEMVSRLKSRLTPRMETALALAPATKTNETKERKDSITGLIKRKNLQAKNTKAKTKRPKMTTNKFIQFMLETMKQDRENNYNIEISDARQMTSLYIIGPAKTGTSTLSTRLNEFIDIQWYEHEFSYWKTCKASIHLWNKEKWKIFINNWFKTVNSTSFISSYIVINDDNDKEKEKELTIDERIRRNRNYNENGNVKNNFTLLHDLVQYMAFNNIDKQTGFELNETKKIINKLFVKNKFTFYCDFFSCDVCDVQYYQHNHWKISKNVQYELSCQVMGSDRSGYYLGKKNSKMANDDAKTLKQVYNSTTIPFCWLVDKSPGDAESPWQSLLYSYYYPKMKFLAIARHPIDQVLSIAWHESKKWKKKHGIFYSFKSMEALVYNFIEKYWIKNGVINLQNQCQKFVNLFENKDDNDDVFKYKYISQSQNIVKNILYQVFVTKNSPGLDYSLPKLEQTFSIILKNPNTLPFFLFWIYIYDERFGYKNWNQFRIIQHEWMFKNLPLSLGIIKCWLQTDKQFNININVNDSDILFTQCSQAYFNNKEYYDSINKIFDQKSNVKLAQRAKNKTITTTSASTIQKIVPFYKPCSDGLTHLLQYRKELLLGNWIEYKFDYYE